MRLSLIAVCLATLGLAVACGGGGGGSAAAAPTGTVTLTLGSDSFAGYEHAVVSVASVDSSLDGKTWTSMGSVGQSYDLIGTTNADPAANPPLATGLQGGNFQTLFSNFTITPGTSLYFRINWSTGEYSYNDILPAAYAYDSAGARHPLAMPATTVVSGAMAVAAGTNQIRIMVNGEQAIQYHPIVSAGSYYLFQATAQAFNLADCATITGNLASGGTAISGAEVYAETVDGGGNATIQRRALSDASGNFVLDALLIGGTSFVVSQPSSASSGCYAAVAAGPVILAAAQTYSAGNLAFASAATPTTVTLDMTPPSINPTSITALPDFYAVTTPFDGTWGELRQSFTLGKSSPTLIVRSQAVATSAAGDEVNFTGVALTLEASGPAYGLTAERSLAGASPSKAVSADQYWFASTPNEYPLSF